MKTFQNCFTCLNNNRYYCVLAAVFVGVLFYFYGCESKVESMLSPKKQITRPELQLEIDYLIGQSRIKFGMLDKQDATKQFILDQLQVIGSDGALNPAGLVPLALSFIAIGFGLKSKQQLATAQKNGTPTVA